MTSRRNHDSFLALLGMIAVAAYVLACRPSFSPDGTKVAFPVFDKDARQSTVLVYDLRTKTMQEIFKKTLLPEIKEEKSPAASTQQSAAQKPSGPLFASSDEDEQLILEVQWLADGKHLVVNDHSTAHIVPFGLADPIRTFQLGNELDAGGLVTMPPPVAGPYQVFSVEGFLVRVNLQTGDIFSVPTKDDYGLLGYQGGRIYCFALRDSNEQGADFELDTLDVESLTRTPLFHLKKDDLGGLEGFPAISRDGTRIAILGEVDDVPQIRLFRGDRLEKALTIAKKESDMEVGIAEWTSDGKVIFGAYRRKTNSDVYQFGILEVPVSGEVIRETPLFTCGSDVDNWQDRFQVTLSPDGRTVAAASTGFGRKDIKPEDHGLYLIDLGSPGRKPTKVTVPFAPIPKQIPEKK